MENRNEEIEVEGKAIISDKRKAESFIQMYHRINRINLSKEDRNKTKSINLRVKQYKEDGEENEPFQEQELETAIKQMAEKKKGGFDRIEPAMIKHCSPGGKRWLLEIINQSWQEGNVTNDVVLRHTLPVFTGLGRCPIDNWDFAGAVSIFGPDALPVVHQ